MSSSGASGSDSCNVSGDATNEVGNFGSYPLWKYVVKGDKMSGGGGNYTWQCNCCKQIKSGSYLEDSICLGMADLSLDEPELKTTFVAEDDDGCHMDDV